MEEKKEETHSFDKIEEQLLASLEDRDPLLQFFAYEHLPEKLQAYSKPIGELARHLCRVLPRNPERTVMLRKLIEAKDCAVRAYIYKEPKS